MPADDNEIIFFWKAGCESLEISIEDVPSLFGEETKSVIFIRHMMNLDAKSFEVTFNQINEDHYLFLDSVLTPMAVRVNVLNPEWKNLYA